MLSKHSRSIDQIKIEFDMKFITSLSLLTNRRIEPIIIKNSDMLSKKDDQEIITGIKCPVIMDVETFEDDKKIIESDILKSFADVLNSEICNRTTKAVNREIEDKIYNRISKKRELKYDPVPCPRCGSTNTVGYGHRMTNVGLKPKRYCKECNKSYTNDDNTIWKMKNSKQVIEDALKMSEEFSLRETARMIREKYNIKLSHGAVLIWRKNKSELLKNLNKRK